MSPAASASSYWRAWFFAPLRYSTAANGTLWSHGFNLDNRFSNSGGSFVLYQLNGSTNASEVPTSDSLVNFDSFAMHWGETCRNDVIKGLSSVVPVPGTLPLLGFGLGMLLVARRRRHTA